MTSPLKAFLSYASERVEEVRAVHRFVEAIGVGCWFDKESLVGGDAWDTERADAQAAADVFLAVISKETVSRDGVIHREINEALRTAKDRRSGQIYIVPLRLDDVPLPEGLGTYHWIDLFRDDWKPKLARTLKKAAGQYGRDGADAMDVAAATRSTQRIRVLEERESDDSGDRLVTYFQYEDAGPYWEYVNAEILKVALGGLYEFRRMMADWPRDRQPSYWERTIQEFHRAGELVSITVAETHYFGHSAHPNHSVRTINIFGPGAGRVGIAELFDSAPAALSALTSYCDFILSQPGQHFADGGFDLKRFEQTYGWELFDHFNVNERGLILQFSAAAGLPHVLGVFEAYVPWEQVAHYIPGSISGLLKRAGMPLG